MSGALRQAGSIVRRNLGSRLSGAQQQQQRGAHDLHAHKNKFVEEWLSRREDIEHEFKWSTANTLWVLALGVGFPVFSYNMVASEMQADDEAVGRPVRSFLWHHADKPADSS